MFRLKPWRGHGAPLLLNDLIANLRALGKRSILALIGIAIGSSSVVATINIGSNAAAEAAMIFKGLGVTTFVAHLSRSTESAALTLVTIDTDQLRRAVANVLNIAPTAQVGGSVVFNGRATNVDVIGSTGELMAAMDLTLREGRFLSDFDQGATYAVVGHTLAQTLESAGKPMHVGDRIRINHYLFQVIGILRHQPDSMLIPVRANDSLFLALEGLRRIDTSAQIDNVIVRLAPDHDISSTAAAMITPLKQMSGAREVSMQVPQQLMDGMSRQNRTFSYLLMALGGVSLVGGGTGVMNVMLMNVSQRRREIGVRMALGARRRDIRQLFILESITLTAVGAFCGGVLGIGGAYLYASFSGWTFFLAPASLPLGVISTLLVGAFSGLYPAVLASRLPPVEALRDE